MLFKSLKNFCPYIIILLAILLNIIARLSVRFCDFYVIHIFPLIVGTYGRLISIFPFSVGEIMLYAAAFLVVLLFLGGFVCVFANSVKRLYQLYAKTCLWLAAIFFFIITTNCFILFHCSPITEFYVIGNGGGPRENGEERIFGVDEITILRNYVVESVNELAEMLNRNEVGYLIYEGDIAGKVELEMKRLGESYDRLAGYYPRPKPLLLSNFFSQQYMMGYFFPFSMEATYNTSMYIINKPKTIAHELLHVKGFMYEDEANFLAFLACAGSEDEFFRYSGYLGILNYVERDFINAIGNDRAAYRSQPQIIDLVHRDNIFLTPAAWEQVEKNAVFSTDFVREISNEILEVNLTLNGVSDGTLSYGRVISLLLKYYDGVLY